MQTTIKIFRWIAVIPSAFLAYFVFYFMYITIQESYNNPASFYMKYLIPIIGSAFSGVFFIIAGFYVAPLYKKKTAFTLMVLAIILCVCICILSFMQKDYLAFISTVATIFGSIMGCLSAFEIENKRIKYI